MVDAVERDFNILTKQNLTCSGEKWTVRETTGIFLQIKR